MKETETKIIQIPQEYLRKVKEERLQKRVKRAFQEKEDLHAQETNFNKEVGC